ncbi:MAG: chlorite dismutase family protein [Thermoprotei archaeon]
MADEIYMNVSVYSMGDSWWSSDPLFRARTTSRISAVLKNFEKESVTLKFYRSMRYDSDFIVWTAYENPTRGPELFQALSAASLGYAKRVYGVMSLYDESPYLKPGGSLADTLRNPPMKYMIVYPMSKSADWYQVSFDERKKIMAEHIGMARSHPLAKGIRSYTTYSFGLGDQEFVVLYETDSLSAWSKVTGKLREAQARKWIVQETPIYVGVLSDPMFLVGEETSGKPTDAIV